MVTKVTFLALLYSLNPVSIGAEIAIGYSQFAHGFWHLQKNILEQSFN